MTNSEEQIQDVLFQVVAERRRENGLNLLKFCLVLLFALFGAALVMEWHLAGSEHSALDFLLFLSLGFFLAAGLFLVKLLVFFWPFLLYFWVNLWRIRQRTVLSLIQTSLETGTSVAEMIRAYATTPFSPWYRRMLVRLAGALEQGFSHEYVFGMAPRLFRYDVAATLELGGNDSETLASLEKLAREERNGFDMQTNTVVRTIYLLVLWIPFVPIVTFTFFAILPKFEAIFKDFDTELPALTQAVVLLGNSAFDRNTQVVLFPLLLIALFLLFFLIHLILQTNIIVVRPWFFRRLFRTADSAKFLRIFGIGLTHAVPIPTILHVYRKCVPSRYLKERSDRIREEIERGRDWIDVLEREKTIARNEAALLEAARRTGNLPTVLEQLAFSKERLQIRSDDFVSKMVFLPCIFFMGFAVGVFVVAMFLPLIKLIETLVVVI